MNLKALCTCVLMFSPWKSVKYMLAFKYILELNMFRMCSLTRVYILYIVDTTPTLLLDEIKHFPLLYHCVTDVTWDSHDPVPGCWESQE